MTELRTGRFTALLPEHLRSREAEALAYAVGRQVERLLAWADGVPFYACLASAPEAVLDHLAVELRAPAYRDTFPLEVKRALIRDALLAYARMGTPAAIDRTIQAIFGYGYVEEWFDYGGEPHHFRAVIGTEDNVDPEKVEELRRVLGSVKRLSSWLDQLIVAVRRTFRHELPVRFGGAEGVSLKGEPPGGGRFETGVSAAYGAAAAHRLTGVPPDAETSAGTRPEARPGAFFQTRLRPKLIE